MCVDGLHTFCWIHHSPESMSSTAEPDLYFPMLFIHFYNDNSVMSFLAKLLHVSFMACHSNIHQAHVPLRSVLSLSIQLTLRWTILFTLTASTMNCGMMDSQITYTTLVSFLSSRERHLQLPADNVTRISYRFLRITIHKWSYNLTFPFLDIYLQGEQNVSLGKRINLS